jgi:hypothetical protein
MHTPERASHFQGFQCLTFRLVAPQLGQNWAFANIFRAVQSPTIWWQLSAPCDRSPTFRHVWFRVAETHTVLYRGDRHVRSHVIFHHN